jgi:monovalent cation:H+ antiporter-2, CPA2 family
MENFPVIGDIVIILLVSIPIIYLFNKIKIPTIVGYLIAGVIIGPFGFKLIYNTEDIQIMAQIGVILLLFTIGLEVSFTKLMQMKKFLIYAGGLQVGITIVVAALIFSFLDFPVTQSIFFGFLLSLSSTAIVLNLLAERNELSSPQGKISTGILIFQDLIIVPMFLILPILAVGTGTTAGNILLQLLYAFGALAGILFLAKVLMPKITYQLANLRVREAFTVGIILLLLGTAYLTHLVGLSFALGAFIAGLILSESEFNYQITAEILPLKDAFNSIFFVSIGLLLNIEMVLQFPLIMLLLVGGIIIIKSAIIIFVIKLLKYPLRIGIVAGVYLAQVGEFSFILSQAGINYDLIDSIYYNAFIASSIFTMILTPFLFSLAHKLASKAGDIESDDIPDAKSKDNLKGLKKHVVIVGFGLNGRNLARVLKETGISYIVIELNPDTVLQEKEKGERIIFGDIIKEKILSSTNIKEANVIVFAISDPTASLNGLKMVKKLNPNIYAIVRTRYITEIDVLMKAGADEVIPEEFETSLQIFSKVLERYHIPLNVIMKQVTLLRGESYNLMRSDIKDISSFVHLNEILAAGLTETYYVDNDNVHAGKTLEEINLRAKTDATVIAIVRENKTISNPAGREKILAKDTMVITGTHQSVDKAFEYLNSPNYS